MGTGYGGYLASQLLAQSDLIKCAVVTAPVVDWMNHGAFHVWKMI